jgi:imidazole glycerol-phosphate synthase subunit HisF
MNHRIIARLDIKGPNVVKGIHLEGLRVLGKPEEFAEHYYNEGADELVYQDIVASLYNRNSLHDIISRTARKIFIPLTVGGGLRSIEDIRNVLRAGADKVILNTAGIKRPQLIREASRIFGSSTIVIAIEAIKQPDGRYLAYNDNGREYTGLEVVEWAKEVEYLGAGEIMITSVDRDGTGMGFDIGLTSLINTAVGIPVIAHGGAGKLTHIREVFTETNVSAICLSSLLHYDHINRIVQLPHHYEEGNIEFLKSGLKYSKVESCSIADVKKYLNLNNIQCRS